MTRDKFFGVDFPIEANPGYTYRIWCNDDREFMQIIAIIPISNEVISLHFPAGSDRYCATVKVEDIVKIELHRTKGSKRRKK